MIIGRKQVATLVAEFLGTGVLALVFLSVQRSTIGIPYFVAIAAGAAVAVASYFFGDISGAHFNPAITLALWTARKVGTVTGALYLVFQCLGAWVAYGVYHYFVSSSLQPIGGHYSARVLFAEAVGAFVLALAWGAAAFKRYDATNRALLLGGSYTLAVIVAAAAGIGIANPAVAIGVRAWAFGGTMGWGTYLLGPILGAVIGVNLYSLLFAGTGFKAATATSSAGATSSTASTSSAKRSGSKRSGKRAAARR
jgi:glycerol uptake facilitator protein